MPHVVQSIARLRLHRNIDVVRGGELDGSRITCIGVTKNAHPGVAGENALQAALGIVASIGHDNHAGVLGETDADATAVMN
jgi:hypothetical protein